MLAIAIIVAATRGGGGGGPLPLPGDVAGSSGDPFAYTPERAADFARRAADGSAHVLYSKSPGGIVASAARVTAYRQQIDAATRGTPIDPATVEAIVLLESAGRPDVVAGTTLDGAAGLTQILAETATSLLGLHVDVARSTRIARSLARAADAGDARKVSRLEAERRRVDERFDPRKAIAATVRYLEIARGRLGRDDLAVESYHMGIGNLEHVIAAYGGGRPSYAQLFFDATPLRHAAAWRLISSFGDDSSLYYWKVLAARDILARYRSDHDALASAAALETAKNSAENVLHPPDSGSFEDPGALRAAYRSGAIVPLPRNAAALGLALDPAMGALAGKLHQPAALYRGLRPAALRLLIAFAARVRAIAGTTAPITVTSTVRDTQYQRRLAYDDIEATHAFSLHTTGWAFDLSRHYASTRQAQAVQFMLDRLQALNLIAWVREPTAIHVTVAGDVDRFVGR